MKKVFIILGICSVIAACGGNSKTGSTDSAATASQQPAADSSATKTATEPSASSPEPGAKLIAASDCLTCHKVDTKVIGPAYKDVAAKYPATEANIDTLANKVIKGGKGHWGDIPMAAHPALSVADAKTMVTYILSLKK
jgi:cytochrome c